MDDRGEAETASKANDHTYRLSSLKQSLSPIGRTPRSRSVPNFPVLSPRGLLSRLFGSASAEPLSSDDGEATEATAGACVDPVSREAGLADLVERRRLKTMRLALVAWRLEAYRARKRRADVSVLFDHGDTKFLDCFDDGAGPANVTTNKTNGVEDGLASEGDSLSGVTHEVWVSVTDPRDGHVVAPKTFLRAVTGGVHHTLRKDCWKLLLRQYDFKHTISSRLDRDTQVQSAYEALKREWKLAALSDEPSDAEHLASFLEHCNTIDQDVSRSDFHDDGDGDYANGLRSVLRTYVTPASFDPAGLLIYLLCRYVYHDLERGYAQGMLDLLEPLLFVLEEESSAYFCFSHLMERTGPRFDRDADHGVEG